MRSNDLAGIGMTSQRTRERLIQRLQDQGITNQSVLDVIRSTPRHLFVDEALSHRAYEDTALPIGFSQTLSQPYIVARMTEILLSEAHSSSRLVLDQVIRQRFIPVGFRSDLCGENRSSVETSQGAFASYVLIILPQGSPWHSGLQEYAPYKYISTAAHARYHDNYLFSWHGFW